MPGARPQLVEFPADEPERARRFWSGLLGLELTARSGDQGSGWQASAGAVAVGIHARGRGPGDTNSLPYFAVAEMATALTQVAALGGTVIHPGERWSVCRDSEGSPFGLALADEAAASVVGDDRPQPLRQPATDGSGALSARRPDGG